MPTPIASLNTADQARVTTYAANLQQSVNLNPNAAKGAEAAVNRLADFLGKAEQIGVNAGDGLTGDEYLLVSQAIQQDPALQAEMQGFSRMFADQFRGGLSSATNGEGEENFGEFGLSGRNLITADGKIGVSVDQAAANFNALTDALRKKNAQTPAEPAASSDQDKTDGAKTSRTDAEKDAGPGSNDGGNGLADNASSPAMDSGGMIDLWAFLLGLLDEDGDGKVSPAELMKGMAKLDRNGDGKLSKKELTASGMSEEQATQLMASVDKDGDGLISLTGPTSELDSFITAANANKDGEISQAELTAALQPKDNGTNALMVSIKGYMAA